MKESQKLKSRMRIILLFLLFINISITNYEFNNWINKVEGARQQDTERVSIDASILERKNDDKERKQEGEVLTRANKVSITKNEYTNATKRIITNTVKPKTNIKTHEGDCKYWDKVIDKYAKSNAESTWAKRIMRCESSCRTQVVNKLGYTGLFQWSPYYWRKQFPKDNIFDGDAQVRNSLWKYRMGGKGIWECK
jgi:hypothetical protein